MAKSWASGKRAFSPGVSPQLHHEPIMPVTKGVTLGSGSAPPLDPPWAQQGLSGARPRAHRPRKPKIRPHGEVPAGDLVDPQSPAGHKVVIPCEFGGDPCDESGMWTGAALLQRSATHVLRINCYRCLKLDPRSPHPHLPKGKDFPNPLEPFGIPRVRLANEARASDRSHPSPPLAPPVPPLSPPSFKVPKYLKSKSTRTERGGWGDFLKKTPHVGGGVRWKFFALSCEKRETRPLLRLRPTPGFSRDFRELKRV